MIQLTEEDAIEMLKNIVIMEGVIVDWHGVWFRKTIDIWKQKGWIKKIKVPEIGDLLSGVEIISDKGIIKKWFNFPRYEVVGAHKDIMFLSVLDDSGDHLVYEQMEISSNQWNFYINKEAQENK